MHTFKISTNTITMILFPPTGIVALNQSVQSIELSHPKSVIQWQEMAIYKCQMALKFIFYSVVMNVFLMFIMACIYFYQIKMIVLKIIICE
ncbi:hypothetical protein ACOME3_009793 [Neoechinorhynchus agilis]